jgi:hypothetical protein
MDERDDLQGFKAREKRDSVIASLRRSLELSIWAKPLLYLFYGRWFFPQTVLFCLRLPSLYWGAPHNIEAINIVVPMVSRYIGPRTTGQSGDASRFVSILSSYGLRFLFPDTKPGIGRTTSIVACLERDFRWDKYLWSARLARCRRHPRLVRCPDHGKIGWNRNWRQTLSCQIRYDRLRLVS